jgi:hypothetical protein
MLARMGFHIAKQTASLFVSLDRAVTVRALLAADPRTAALTPDWDGWLVDCKRTIIAEIDHRIATLTANAVATQKDNDLDDLSDETWVATADDEAERLFYYKGKSNSDFKSPRLGKQYLQMGTWITHMTGSQNGRIADIGARLAVKHGEATAAITTAQDADTASREFRLTGDRRQLIDRFNALGKGTEGTLKEMPFARPELRLPNNFVERFMRAARSVVPPTVDELTKKRDAVKEELDAAQAELDAAIKVETDAAVEAARLERAANEKKLAEAQVELDKKAAAVAELKAKLEKP